MNLESLYQKIRQPETLNSADIPALKDLCTKYPYAQLFSVLYLKALAQSKDLHFEDELQQHAYKITDRAKLFDLIQGVQEAVKPQHVAAPAAPETPEAPDTSGTPDATPVPPIPAEDTEIEEKSEPENIPAPQEEDPKIEELSPEKSPETPKIQEIDELEKEILSSVMATAYSLELEEKQREDEQNKEIEPLPPQHVAAQDPAPQDERSKIDLNTNRSFTSWLKLSSSVKTQHVASRSQSQSQTPETPQKDQKDEIIEKFIREEPERIKPKTEFYSAPKKAKESISDDKLIYTETLANIYALQGNYPKAITAFQQLMLTIPEKKLYFAQKIEELNKKINS